MNGMNKELEQALNLLSIENDALKDSTQELEKVFDEYLETLKKLISK